MSMILVLIVVVLAIDVNTHFFQGLLALGLVICCLSVSDNTWELPTNFFLFQVFPITQNILVNKECHKSLSKISIPLYFSL